MLLEPATGTKVHSLRPLHVVLGVPDLAKPRLTILEKIARDVEHLLKDKLAVGVRVGGVSRALSFGLSAVLDGRLVVAVPGDRLAPDLSVVVDFLHENTSNVGLELFKHENLFEVPWVLHLDLIGDRVRIVDTNGILADIIRFVVAVVDDLNIGPQVSHRLVHLLLLVSVPVGPVPLRVAEGPLSAGEHVPAAPELSDHYELVKVEVGAVIGVSKVEPDLGTQVSLRHVPSGVFFSEFRHNLRHNLFSALVSTAIVPVASNYVGGNVCRPGVLANDLTIFEPYRR